MRLLKRLPGTQLYYTVRGRRDAFNLTFFFSPFFSMGDKRINEWNEMNIQ